MSAGLVVAEEAPEAEPDHQEQSQYVEDNLPTVSRCQGTAEKVSADKSEISTLINELVVEVWPYVQYMQIPFLLSYYSFGSTPPLPPQFGNPTYSVFESFEDNAA